MQAVILAGGLGTRLRSVVADRPKVLAPVAGRPFLAWILDELSQTGFDTICLATGYLGEQVEAMFGDQHRPNIDSCARLVYSREVTPLGTGGAIRQALRILPQAPTFVLNGDTFIRPNWRGMMALHQAANARLTIAVRHVEDVARYGAVEVIDGHVRAFGEKVSSGPGWINAGVYLLNSRIFDLIPPDLSSFSMEGSVIGTHLAALQPSAFVTDGPFLDIGIPDDFSRASLFMQQAMRLD